MYFVSRRSLNLSRRAELGVSGHPLTGPCQEAIAFFRNPLSVASKSKHNPAATRLPADSNRTRFLALLAANRIAPVTHQVQACRDVLRPPWRRWPPQRNVGTKPCPRGWSHWCGCRDGDASPRREKVATVKAHMEHLKQIGQQLQAAPDG